MTDAPKTAEIVAQIVARETARHALTWRYPQAYAEEFFRERLGWFGVSVFGPPSSGHAAKALVGYAERVDEPLVDVMVQMADAYLQIKGYTWENPADRERAIAAAREGAILY